MIFLQRACGLGVHPEAISFISEGSYFEGNFESLPDVYEFAEIARFAQRL